MIDIRPALLEDWFRTNYFSAQYDISCSGVEPVSLRQIRNEVGISTHDLDRILFRDSPSVGSDELVAAISQRYELSSSVAVLSTHGASEGIFLALASVISVGDEVVVINPGYQSLTSVAEALGAKLVSWELRAADDFVPDLDQLRELVTVRTKAIIVNFPHNPTGATLTTDQQSVLVGLARSVDAFLLWDASFSEATYDVEPLEDPIGSYSNTISFYTMSKCFGLPGLRVGWVLSNRGVNDQMVHLRDYTTISTSPISEYIALRVLEKAEEVLDVRRQRASRNRDRLVNWSLLQPSVMLPVPTGGFSAFPNIGIGNSRTFCETILRNDGVLVVPGDCFGHPQHVRVGFGGAEAPFEKGLQALGVALGGAQ